MRGFLSGVVWAGLLSVAGVAALSMLTTLSPPPEVVQEPPTLSGTPNRVGQALPTDPPGADAEIALATPVEPAVPEPDQPTAPVVETSRTAAPAVGANPAMPERPEAPTTRNDMPVSNSESLDGASKAAVRPFPPPAGEAGAQADLTPGSMPEVGETVGAVASVPADPGPDIAITQAPAPSAVPAQIDPPDVGNGPDAEAEALGATHAPRTEAAQGQARIAALPQAGTGPEASTGPSIGTPVARLTDRSSPAGKAPETESVSPLREFSAPFEGADTRSLMAVILIDAPGSVGAEALADFPYPVSLAIDPTVPGAAERAARHRAAGLEVVALVDLPRAATAQDAEVLLAAGLDRLPETVALIEGIRSGIQGSRDMARQVTDVARDTGRGLITQPSGLNTVQKLALRDGVPSAVVFRDIDGNGQSAEAIRQMLDRAAFRAGQEEGVVVLGRVRPETISALALWGLQDRSGRVTVAPVSAVLRRAMANR